MTLKSRDSITIYPGVWLHNCETSRTKSKWPFELENIVVSWTTVHCLLLSNCFSNKNVGDVSSLKAEIVSITGHVSRLLSTGRYQHKAFYGLIKAEEKRSTRAVGEQKETREDADRHRETETEERDCWISFKTAVSGIKLRRTGKTKKKKHKYQ